MSEDLNDQMKIRREKLSRLEELGTEVYPYHFDRSHSITDFLADFDVFLEKETVISLAGRIVSKRGSFVHLMDRDNKCQLYVPKKALEGNEADVFAIADLGDWIGVSGTAFLTKTGEPTLRVKKYKHLCKSLRPLPSMKEVDGKSFSAFSDVEARYRHRYLDLIVSPEVRETFKKRSVIVRSIRHYLDDKGFLEVETPALQPLYGGANARPFVTHHNSLDFDLFLRISDELYLKRLIVGGMERVYEIGHNFRNEGMDRNHNPEFTALEFYTAYMDYYQGMDMVEEFIKHLVSEGNKGDLKITWEDNKIDFSKPFTRARISDLLRDEVGVDILTASNEELWACCKKNNVDIDPKSNYGQLVDELFSELIEPKLIQPTFVMDHPKAVSPLAKRHRDDGELLVERFELFIAGMEFGNAFSELNDPIDQRQRMEAQAKLKEGGDDEANVVDEDFLMALEYGMPPTFGFGLGVDRFVMLMTNSSSIKDVILFPTLRPDK